jgi:hypothetical protein
MGWVNGVEMDELGAACARGLFRMGTGGIPLLALLYLRLSTADLRGSGGGLTKRRDA